MATKKKRPRRPRPCHQGPKRLAAKVKSREDLATALALRLEGKSVRDVAAAIGRSIGWVSQEVARSIEELPLENAKVYRAHILARQESVISAHWEKRAVPEHAKVIQASDKLLMDLLGLAAATRAELSGPGGGPIGTVDFGSLTDDQLRAIVGGDFASLAGAGGDGATPPAARRERPPST